jgi:hypothetical protein
MPSIVSTIDFASVSNAIDAHHAGGIVDLVDHTIIAYPNSPIVVSFDKLSATSWARIPRQPLNRRDYMAMELCGELPEVSFSSAFEEDAIHSYLPLRFAR